MKSKKLFSLCLASVLALSLTGCATQGTQGQSETQSDTQSSAPLSQNTQTESSTTSSTENSQTTSESEPVASGVAVNITENTSIYAANRNSLNALTETNEELGTYSLDKNTLIPVYSLDLYEYARTGKFEITQSLTKNDKGEEVQEYIANAVNKAGGVVGQAYVTLDGEDMVTKGLSYRKGQDNEDLLLDFGPDSRRINSLMKKRGINPKCKEIKLVNAAEIGYVYYINNGDSEYIAAVGMGDFLASGELFNEENEGIVEVDENFKAFADKKLVELNEYKEWLSTLPPGEPPPTGDLPDFSFVVDNTPFMEEN